MNGSSTIVRKSGPIFSLRFPIKYERPRWMCSAFAALASAPMNELAAIGPAMIGRSALYHAR